MKLPGFSKDIKASRAEAKKLLAEAGVPNLKFTLWNRNLAMPLHAGRHLPGRPVAADRRRGRAQAVRHRALSCDDERRQPRRGDRLLEPVHG